MSPNLSPPLAAKLWSRRTVALKAPAAAAAALAFVSGCTPSERLLRPDGEIRHMDSFTWSMWSRLVQVFLPVAPDSVLVAPDKLPLLRNIDEALASLDEVTRTQLSDGLKLLNYGAVVIGFHWRPFLALDDEAATTYLRRLEAGSIAALRGLIHVLKQFVFTAYWQEPATWAPVGYAGPFTKPNGIPLQGNAPLPADDMP